MTREADSRGCGLLPRLDEVPAVAIETARPWMPVLTAHITRHIQVEIGAYAGPPGGRRETTIREAVAAALEDFLALASGNARLHAEVDRRFRWLGAAMVAEGREVGPLLAALHVASSEVWHVVRSAARTSPLAGEEVAQLGAGVTDYLRHLAVEVEHGYLRAHVARHEPRVRLLHELFSGHADPQRLTAAAAAAGWPVPQQVVVLVVGGPDQRHRPPDQGFRPGTVTGVHDGWQVVVVDSDKVADDGDLYSVVAGTPPRPLAVSWPVAVNQVAHAFRWARRAIELYGAGRLGCGAVIRCADHVASLWEASDPMLRGVLARQALEPLDRVKDRYRAELQETMLRWLLTRETADQLAEHLGVHAQTVRYRLRRVRELFGDRLDDPEQVKVLVTALSSPPAPGR